MRCKIDFWELDPEGFHLVVTGKLMDTSISLLLDTGANHTCFDRTFFDQLHNGETVVTGHDEVNVGIGGDDFETLIAEVEGLTIGRTSFPKMEVRLIDLQNVNAMYNQAGFPSIQGVLGGDFFHRYQAVINYKTGKLQLHF